MDNNTFHALAHPVRRSIVERLATGEATVGIATAGLGVSKPVISKHLKVLEEAGLVARTIEGRTHRLKLNGESLAEVADWVEQQRMTWLRLFDVVEEYLEGRSAY